MTKAELDRLLSTPHLGDLRGEMARLRGPLSLPEAQQVTEHAKTLAGELKPLPIAIVHTYTSDLLDPWLALAGALQGLDVQPYHAPYGLALQEATPDSALVRHRPAITLLMLRREDLHPDLSRPITGLAGDAQAALRDAVLANLREWVGLFRIQPVGHLIVTVLPSLAAPTLGHYDPHAEASEAAWWAGAKAAIGGWMREAVPASLFLDQDELLQQIGRNAFFDRRYWYSARFPYAPDAARELARRIAAVGAVLSTPRAKVLVLDADNTLWGGVVGEDGFDGIAIGPDYPGNAYLDFQRRILDFQQRGLILAMCSKNNPEDVDQVLKDHPHQLLRDEHFAARRVNWTAKPDNLISLAEELNLGLDSFIFVDDSDHECAAVRLRLPQVEVIQVPKRQVDIPTCLDHVARLEVLSLTREDLAKTELYAQERRRREFSESVAANGNGTDYLTRLQMAMTIRLAPATHVPRLAQLTQKTNQFNLTTRRYDEQQMQSFMASGDWIVADFSLADTFGDSGIVGLAMFRIEGGASAELDTFLMSCRVIGRQAEAAFMHGLLRHLAERGVREVVADYLPTRKNDLVKNFLPEQGYAQGSDGRWRRDLVAAPPKAAADFPIAIDLQQADPP
ncbi:MAG: HAD-IIIC family phosphatase [Proteobacteria bacterium]|nr:HAD-IIIC family phosphatase [Pseudomonadota bacterium]